MMRLAALLLLVLIPSEVRAGVLTPEEKAERIRAITRQVDSFNRLADEPIETRADVAASKCWMFIMGVLTSTKEQLEEKRQGNHSLSSSENELLLSRLGSVLTEGKVLEALGKEFKIQRVSYSENKAKAIVAVLKDEPLLRKSAGDNLSIAEALGIIQRCQDALKQAEEGSSHEKH